VRAQGYAQSKSKNEEFLLKITVQAVNQLIKAHHCCCILSDPNANENSADIFCHLAVASGNATVHEVG
jgi:hypothetical protein